MTGQSNAAPEEPELINRIAGFCTWQNVRRAHDAGHAGEQQRGASAAA